MKRKDGRDLITEHPVTGADMVEYIHADDLPPMPAGTGAGTRCYQEPFADSTWMDDDPSSDDFDTWGA